MSKIALITGATSGIGREVAVSMARAGFDIIITGRRMSLLSELSKKIENDFKCRVLCLSFDVRDPRQTEQYLNNLPDNWKNIDVLVNNAGLAVGLTPIQSGILDDWERMIDTNIKGVLYVTKIISNYMIKRGGGHIINIGSIAGKDVYPNGNVYCATKHAVDALSKAMLIDLYEQNIRVSQICPGAVETEFSEVRFKGDKERAANVYKGFKPLTAEDVANVVMFVATLPQHVNISDLTVMPSAQASPSMINKK